MSAYDMLPANAATDYNPLTGDFTVEALVYTEIVGAFNYIISKRNGSLSFNPGWQLLIDTGNKFRAIFCEGGVGESYATSTTPIEKNTWTRLAAVFDRDENCILYIQGVEAGTGTMSGHTSSITNTEPLDVGASSHVSFYYGGLISEIKYSNVARTPAEIVDSYLNGFTTDAHTVGLWRPDSYGIFRDEVNGNDLTAIDTANSESIYIPRDEGIISNDISSAVLRNTGKVKYNAEISSNCGDFDGSDDYINIGDADNFSFGDGATDSPFSLSAWVNLSDVSLSNIVSKLGEWDFIITSGDLLGITLFDGGDSITRATDTITHHENEWTHICGTYDGGGIIDGLKVYVNGIRSDTTDFLSGSYGSMTAGSNNVYVSSPSNTCDGLMFDVRIHNTELTQSEVKSVMNGATSDSEVGWWPLGEGQGDIAYDVSGNSNNGTITNATFATFWASTQTKFHYNLNYGFSNGIYLNGADAAANIDSSDFNPETNDWSIGIIFQGYADPLSVDTWIISKHNVAGWGIYLRESTNVISSYMSAGGSSRVYGTSDLADGNIHYAEITFKRSGYITIYVDGVYENSKSIASISGSVTSPNDFYIGRSPSDASWFNGMIHKVRYSNKVRTADDVLNTYNNGMVVDGHTVALWDFKNGGGIDTAYRVQGLGKGKGTGYNLTMSNTEHIRLPANAADLTLDVSGQPIEHLAGKWHNNAETTIDFTGGKDTPFVNNIYEGYGVFNGTTAYIDCGDHNEFSFGDGSDDNPFSVSVWIKMSDASKFVIVSKYAVGKEEWFLETNSSDDLYFAIYDNSASANRYIVLANLEVYEGSWVYICATYDGSGDAVGMKIYVNGIFQSTTPFENGSYVSMENTTAPVLIGKDLLELADGCIRDVRIYNGELSAGQVVRDYKVGEIISTEDGINLVAQYKLYRDAEDSGINSFHGTNTAVTFPKVTIPTSYSFGDSLANPMFKKVVGDIIIVSSAEASLHTVSSFAYGIWEFDWKADGAFIKMYIISDSKNSSVRNGYLLDLASDRILFRIVTDGVEVNLFRTDTGGFLDVDVWYNIRIVRNETLNQYVNGDVGTFAVYINGSLMDLTGGNGTNPHTDNTYTSSNYMTLYANDSGNYVRNIKINGKIVNYSTFNGDWSDFSLTGDRENSYVFFERGYINPTAIKPIHTYTKSKTIDDTLQMARFTTTTSSSTSTSTTSTSSSTTSTSSTSTSTSTTTTSLSTSTT